MASGKFTSKQPSTLVHFAPSYPPVQGAINQKTNSNVSRRSTHCSPVSSVRSTPRKLPSRLQRRFFARLDRVYPRLTCSIPLATSCALHSGLFLHFSHLHDFQLVQGTRFSHCLYGNSATSGLMPFEGRRWKTLFSCLSQRFEGEKAFSMAMAPHGWYRWIYGGWIERCNIGGRVITALSIHERTEINRARPLIGRSTRCPR